MALPAPAKPEAVKAPGVGRLWALAGVACVVLLAAAGGGAWMLTRPATAPPAQIAVAPPVAPPAVADAGVAQVQPAMAFLAPGQTPPVVTPAPVPATPPAPIPVPLPPLLTEAEILARAPDQMEAYRFAPQPEIMVLQFSSLAEQANALNRAAALLEKAGYPRDRVVDSAELDRSIRAQGAEPESFYYGHDYRASDLVRFFDLMRAGGLPPTTGEAALLRMMEAWGWTRATNGALISLVRDSPEARIDLDTRATILRHELSHGNYFTTPAYVRFSRDFWTKTLTAAERGKFITFLGSEGYDTGIEDLVVNETQAYLMHTQNPRFFNAQAIGMSQQRLDALRVLFLTGMPPGWLRDCTVAPAVATPARAPRRRRYRGLSAVRRTRTVADRRPPARVAASTAVRSSFT